MRDAPASFSFPNRAALVATHPHSLHALGIIAMGIRALICGNIEIKFLPVGEAALGPVKFRRGYKGLRRYSASLSRSTAVAELIRNHIASAESGMEGAERVTLKSENDISNAIIQDLETHLDNVI